MHAGLRDSIWPRETDTYDFVRSKVYPISNKPIYLCVWPNLDFRLQLR